MKKFNSLSVLLQLKYVFAFSVGVLIILHFPMQYLFDTGRILGFETIHELFDLDGEDVFGAFVSQAMFLISAYIIFTHKKLQNRFRYILSALLVYFSMDEIISLHERFIPIFSDLEISGSGFFSFTWLYVGVPVAISILLGVAAIYNKTSTILPRNFFIGIAVFLVGAVGFEGIGGLLTLTELQYSVFMVGIEESIELIGGYFIISSLLIQANSTKNKATSK